AQGALPSRFPSLRRARVGFLLGDGARVGEHRSLQILERHVQERGDPDQLVEGRLGDATELPPLDRSWTDPADVAQPRARVAGAFAAFLQQRSDCGLLDAHRQRSIRGSTVGGVYPVDRVLFRISVYLRALTGIPRIRWINGEAG